MVAARTRPGCGSRTEQLVLKQESLSDVGWFTQTELAIEPEQLDGLKVLLTGSAARKLTSTVTDRPFPATIPFSARSA